MSQDLKRRLIRKPEVAERTGLTIRGLDNRVAAGKFPKPVLLDARQVAWVDAEVDAWIAERIAEREAAEITPARASILAGRSKGGKRGGAVTRRRLDAAASSHQ